jgi:probable phosphoglycerate mutase
MASAPGAGPVTCLKGAPEVLLAHVDPDVAARARAVVDRAGGAGVPDVLLFAHGHLLRMVAVSWIEAPWELAWRLPLEPAHLSVLGWDRGTAVLDRWNA